MATANRVARRARATTRKTAANPALELLERAGYVIRGVLYAAMGTFALGLALGLGGTATDQSGSLRILTGGPAGNVMLFAVVIGLGAYSIWGFVRAVFDPLHRGHDGRLARKNRNRRRTRSPGSSRFRGGTSSRSTSASSPSGSGSASSSTPTAPSSRGTSSASG